MINALISASHYSNYPMIVFVVIAAFGLGAYAIIKYLLIDIEAKEKR